MGNIYSLERHIQRQSTYSCGNRVQLRASCFSHPLCQWVPRGTPQISTRRSRLDASPWDRAAGPCRRFQAIFCHPPPRRTEFRVFLKYWRPSRPLPSRVFRCSHLLRLRLRRCFRALSAVASVTGLPRFLRYGRLFRPLLRRLFGCRSVRCFRAASLLSRAVRLTALPRCRSLHRLQP